MEEYEQSFREVKTMYRGDKAYNTLMARKTRKGFMSAAYFFGIAIAFFMLDFLMPKGDLSSKGAEIFDIFRLIAWALLSSSAFILMAVIFAKGFLPIVLVAFNWVILPLVILDGILKLWGLFMTMESPVS